MKTRVLYVCGAAIVIAAALGQLGAQVPATARQAALASTLTADQALPPDVRTGVGGGRQEL